VGQSGTYVLLCTFESNNAGFSSFPVGETSVMRVIIVPLHHGLKKEALHHVTIREKQRRQDNCHAQKFLTLCELSCGVQYI
jgi:hypothetical protein